MGKHLRLRGAGAVLFANLLTLVPALMLLSGSPVFPDMAEGPQSLVVVLVLIARCQLGLLLGAVCLGALAWRRLRHTEDLLDD